MAFSIREEEQPQRHRFTSGCPTKESPTPAPASPTPRLGNGQQMSAGDNWALIVFYKPYGGKSPASLPAEMARMFLYLRSTRSVVCLSSLGMVAQDQHWKHLEPKQSLSPSVWIWSMTCDGTIPLRNKGWRVTGGTSQLQANGIFQLHVYNDSYCPVIGRRLNRIYSRFSKQNLESV